MKVDFSEIKTFFLDLDKTVWNWDKPIIGSQDLMDTLEETDRRYFFHTDNTVLSREQYAKKLSSMKIRAEKDDIITSGYVAAEKISEDGFKKVYAIGEQGLMDELEEKDLEVSKDAEAVVAGLDRSFNYQKLRKAMKILEEGGKLYFCSTEKTFRKSSGTQPHQAPINEALKQYASETELAGKPGKAFRKKFKNYFTYIPTNSAFIGDREADIRTGNQLGMKTGAVMSGDLDRKQLARADEEKEPNFGLSNLTRLKKRIY